MGEFELIKRYFTRGGASANVPVSVGDDCAVMNVPQDQQLAVSIDTLVPDVHFFSDAPARDIATRALCVSLSDLAAMGAEPLCFTLALSMPEVEEAWLKDFSEGLFSVSDRYLCPLVGGDTVKGPLQISIQVHGTVPRGKAIRRSGARVGDVICVSGPLGDGAAALHLLSGHSEVGSTHHDYLRTRYFAPEPQIALGLKLLGLASAAIDISDGLLADLGHICDSSGVGAVVDTRAIPQSDAMCACGEETQRLRWALSGGDDYQLCFTLPKARLPDLKILQASYPWEISLIGEVSDQKGIFCQQTGQILGEQEGGYTHFS